MPYITLEQRSRELRQDANQLLADSGVVKVLSKYGEVSFTGSYALNLMHDPDIDIRVINPKMTKEQAIAALTDLINLNFFNGHMFYDWINFSKKGFPQGYYLGLKDTYHDRRWKIDIWFTKKANPMEREITDFVKGALTEETRQHILALKAKRHQTKTDLPSHEIYYAVLRDGITDWKLLKEKIGE